MSSYGRFPIRATAGPASPLLTAQTIRNRAIAHHRKLRQRGTTPLRPRAKSNPDHAAMCCPARIVRQGVGNAAAGRYRAIDLVTIEIPVERSRHWHGTPSGQVNPVNSAITICGLGNARPT